MSGLVPARADDDGPSLADINQSIIAQIDLPPYLLEEMAEFKREQEKVHVIQVGSHGCKLRLFG